VIVAEATKVTIYDGDDPSLPMWMVFNVSWSYASGTMLVLTANPASITSLFMQNGKLSVVSTHATDSGLHLVDFLEDRGQLRSSVYSTYTNHPSISQRNTSLGMPLAANLPALINNAINDVAMTVLPDAPTDPATGLPVPTIAVATNGGVSVIRDDGTVVDSLHTYIISNCAFNNEGLFYAKDGGTAVFNFASFADIAGGDGFGDEIAGQTVGSKDFDILTRPTELTLLGETISVGGRVEGTGVVNGVALHAPDHTDFTKGMSSFATSSYNTGWMPGDIKMAALADTTAETLSGTPLLDDDFSTYASTAAMKSAGWSSTSSTGTGDISLVSGAMQLDSNGTSNRARGSRSFTTFSGKTYVVEYSATGTATVNHHFRVGTAENGTQNLNALNRPAGSNVSTFVATDTTTYVTWEGFNAAGSETQIDNVSVRLADPDRSVNGNGLGVHGSITKAPVATGADVVGYSGFSTSNYLEQPYNSDLDFGTGDFCVMGWVTYGSGGFVFERRKPDGTGNFIHIYKSGSVINARAYSTSASTVSGTVNVNDGAYHHFAYVRTGGVEYLYVDGSLDTSVTQSADDISANEQASFVGVRAGLTNPDLGSLALLRISATAPTADQIAKIYNDEKMLFQDSAKATLTGSSDAVTALAYDPDTNLLHVGTSGGRSVFQGLRRVDETATAVTTAISAVDGLVVEQ
jgi:hypothetical protein